MPIIQFPHPQIHYSFKYSQCFTYYFFMSQTISKVPLKLNKNNYTYTKSKHNSYPCEDPGQCTSKPQGLRIEPHTQSPSETPPHPELYTPLSTTSESQDHAPHRTRQGLHTWGKGWGQGNNIHVHDSGNAWENHVK